MARETKVDSQQPERRAVVHELNNSLAIILAECELLENVPTKQADAAARIKVIKTTAQQMADRISTRPWPAESRTPKV